jgi:hypothetical protein
MPIVPLAPEHERFVYSSWCAGAGEPRIVLEGLLARGARCVVLTGARDPGLLVGWAAAMPAPHQQYVVWAYTRATAGGASRGRGVMRALLGELGVDVTKPMTALFDSPACQGLVRKGWPITVAKGNHEPQS